MFDGNDSGFYTDWANSVNRLFSLLSLDDNASFDDRYLLQGSGVVTGIIEGGNIDTNSLDGHVRIDFDDANYNTSPQTYTGDKNFSGLQTPVIFGESLEIAASEKFTVNSPAFVIRTGLSED